MKRLRIVKRLEKAIEDHNYAFASISDWEDVGRPGLSASTAIDNCIAIDNAGIPYVVYQDVANLCRVTVKNSTAQPGSM
jgi:hypothetical protein